MTEDGARELIRERFGSAVTEKIGRFVDLVIAENLQQNLVSASTISTVWVRHVLDSIQLLSHVKSEAGVWADIGSGGGFPGMVVGIARSAPTLLIEPRRRRATFLQEAIYALGIGDRVRVAQTRVEKVQCDAAVISARAVAGLAALFDMADHLNGPLTRWVLPRGQLTSMEVNELRKHWTFVFHVEHSEASDTSSIAIFDRVSRR